MRAAFILTYNGTHFLGSQTQTQTSNTILGTLEKAFHQINIDAQIIASGRTDKGVHATRQVCHVDLPFFWSDLNKLQRILNEILPGTVMVKSIKAVDDEFHARYSAKKRVYRYIIKKGKPNPFENDFVTFLNSVQFQEIAQNIKLFVGEHDFQFFMKTGSDTKSSIRVIYKAFAYQYKGYIILNFEANGFLRSQIRLMVAALLQLSAIQIQEQLLCKKNYKIKPAPCNGLYLTNIKY